MFIVTYRLHHSMLRSVIFVLYLSKIYLMLYYGHLSSWGFQTKMSFTFRISLWAVYVPPMLSLF
jgi:hypothetical protein